MIEKEYLDRIIVSVNELRAKVQYKQIDTECCDVSFMATRKISFVGYKQGYSEQLIRSEKGIKETPKVRSNCTYYKRIAKDAQGRLLQIESFARGKIDCLHQTYWIGNTCYSFLYSPNGSYYPTYSYVTKWKNEKIVEEYMVAKNQIVYEKYFDETNLKAMYYYINYVHNGMYPVLEEKKGVFKFNPLRFECIYSDNWLKHRKT